MHVIWTCVQNRTPKQVKVYSWLPGPSPQNGKRAHTQYTCITCWWDRSLYRKPPVGRLFFRGHSTAHSLPIEHQEQSGTPNQVVLWMDQILHHFETMGIHCLLMFTSFPGFFGCAGFRPSTVAHVIHAGFFFGQKQPRFPTDKALQKRASDLLNLERQLFGAWCSFLFSRGPKQNADFRPPPRPPVTVSCSHFLPCVFFFLFPAAFGYHHT